MTGMPESERHTFPGEIRESEPVPLAVLTVEESIDGPRIRPYTELDAQHNELSIEIYPDSNTGSWALATAFTKTLIHEIDRSGKPVAALLAADTTHATGDPGFYRGVGRAAAQSGLDLNTVRWFHLDNYWYPKDTYPDRTDDHDFATYLLTHFITPNRISTSQFVPIRSQGSDPRITASEYERTVTEGNPVAATFGIGPLPEAHIGYLPQGTLLHLGFRHFPLSEATVSRNRSRGEYTPQTAISIGPSVIRPLRWKFITSWKNPEVIEAVFTGPITLDVVGTMIRRPGFRTGTRVFLNTEAARTLIDRIR